MFRILIILASLAHVIEVTRKKELIVALRDWAAGWYLKMQKKEGQ